MEEPATYIRLCEPIMGFQNDKEAWILANTYALCPPWSASPTDENGRIYGKYEPDHQEGEAERFMILAQLNDATNILILYDPHELPP